jgi:hypothetical protein
LSLPVLAVPFWGRPQSLLKKPTREAASIENHPVPHVAPVREGRFTFRAQKPRSPEL